MTKVCSDCGEEIREGFFSSAETCKECGKYICDDCSIDTGKGVYCKECFENIR